MSVSEADAKVKTEEVESGINLYESLSLLSEKMMAAAEREEWNGLFAHQIKHQETSNRLKALGRNQLLEAKDIGQKANLIKKILSVNRQTQEQIRERLKKLQKGIQEEKKITQAYKSVSLFESGHHTYTQKTS